MQPSTPPVANKWRPLLLWGVPVLVLLGAAAYWYSQRDVIKTDNAYVKSHKTVVSTRVAGTVAQLFVEENARVRKGERLFELDSAALQVSVDEARAHLDEVRSEIAGMKAQYAQKLAELDVARRTAQFAAREANRQKELASRQLVAQQKRDDADEASQLAAGRTTLVERDIGALRARLGGDAAAPVDDHPQVKAAAAALAGAELNLSHAIVYAPRDGVVSHLPEIGAHLSVGEPALAIVADDVLWVEANFKETELARVRDGQPVEVTIDTYGDRVWRGRVESIAQATGAEFSVLPPQNASGNWVKVVQRVPVRIALERSPEDPPLRAGMSAYVRIDTRASVGVSAAAAQAAE